MKTKKMSVLIVLGAFLLVFSITGTVCSETNNTMDLVSMLTSQVGVTETQATGGAGSLFSMAKNMLPESDYGKVAAAIPGIGDLISAAPAVSKSTSDASNKMSGLAAGMGNLAKSVDNANKFAAVYDQFKQLGLKTEMVSKFIPVLLSFADTAGGETVTNILKSVWQ